MQDIGYAVSGLGAPSRERTVGILDGQLASLIDLSLTLKHIPWNIVGHNFIAIHEMLDPQAAAAHKMVDTTAERIAALGGTPIGTPATVAARRNGDGYSLGRAPVYDHLIALDQHFATVIEGHRSAQVELAELDPVSEDMVIEQLRALEHFQWLIRAHLEIG